MLLLLLLLPPAYATPVDSRPPLSLAPTQCVEFPGHDDAVVAVVLPHIEAEALNRVAHATAAATGSDVHPFAAARREQLQYDGDGAEYKTGRRDGAPGPRVAAEEEDILFSASLDNTVRCWDDYDVSQRFQLEELSLTSPSVPDTEVSCMRFLPHLNLLATGNDDGSVRLWNPDSGCLFTATEHANTVSCFALAVTAKEVYLLSGGFDGAIALWATATSLHEGRFAPQLDGKIADAHGTDGGRPVEVRCLAFHPRLQLAVSGGNDAVLKCWSMSTLLCVACSSAATSAGGGGHADAVTCVALDADVLFSGSDDATIRTWSVASALDGVVQPLHCVALGEAVARDMLFMESTGYLLTALSDGVVAFWDYTSFGAPDGAAAAGGEDEGAGKDGEGEERTAAARPVRRVRVNELDEPRCLTCVVMVLLPACSCSCSCGYCCCCYC